VLAAAGGMSLPFLQIVVLGAAAFSDAEFARQDRAAALAIEQAILPSTATTPPHARLRVVQRDSGRGTPSARARGASALLRDYGVDPLDSLRAAVILYATLYA